MNLYFRLCLLLFLSLLRPRIKNVLSPSSLRMHVWPFDLDVNGHMNNGRYPTLMDLGRLDMIIRAGFLRVAMRQKSVPVLAAIKIRFRISISPFQAFDLQTRVVCWDDKWVYMEQRFVLASGPKTGAVAAIALVKTGFYDRRSKTTMPTQDLLAALGRTDQSPPMPDYIQKWAEAEEALRVLTQDGDKRHT